MKPHNIEKLKKTFLAGTESGTRESALEDAVLSAVRRNLIYSPGHPPDKKNEFREHWKQCLDEIAAQYKEPVSGATHCANIVALSKRLTSKHKNMLEGGRFQIGTAQKSLNVYLKHLWCMGDIPMPVHCTIDRVILQAAGIYGAWTKCDDITEYQDWIERLEKVAEKENLPLAEWELVTWRPVSKNA